MKNLRRYTEMWVTIMVIALAAHAGMATAATWQSGPCNAYYENGGLAASATNGCCIDQTNVHPASAMGCSEGNNTCNYWEDGNGGWNLRCSSS